MNIEEILLYLEEKAGCTISLATIDKLFRTSERLRFSNFKTLHNHPFCEFIKNLDGNISCAVNRERSSRVAQCGKRLCGCCPFGIWEVMQPVVFKGRLAAIVYLGDFTTPEGLVKIQSYKGYNGPRPSLITSEKKAVLCHYASFFAEFLLCELDYASKMVSPPSGKHKPPSFYLQTINNLIALHYKENIRLEDAAHACGVAPNYLENFLKKHKNTSFRKMLETQRILEAQACLKFHSEMNIAEIAYECGFKSSNYFSHVYRQLFGKSPSEYRSWWWSHFASASETSLDKK